MHFVPPLDIPSKITDCWMIGAGHVSFPYKFKSLYPDQDWLQYVKDHHKYDQLELREENSGNILKTYRMTPKALHSSRDLVVACFSSKDEERELVEYKKENVYLSPNNENLSVGDRVTFVGYQVKNSGLENEIHSLQVVEGQVNLLSGESRVFAKPAKPLEMGLCGGPVLNESGNVVGILEGVVNPPSSTQEKKVQEFCKHFQGDAIFIPIGEAINLIKNVS